MTVHREGYASIAIGTIIFIALNLISFYFITPELPALGWVIFFATLFLLLFLISFFRVPDRALTINDGQVIAPADGKVVVIEEVFEPEYFEDKRLQISVFMSPANVHVNRAPIAGEVKYSKYHDGKYLVAWHPKSSTENERTSIVIDNGSVDVLVRQIAGKVARRIVY